MAWLGVFVTIGAFGLYNVAISRMPAARAAMSINLVPVVAIAAGWLLLGEALGWLQIVAIAIVGAGVFLGETGAGEKEPADALDAAPATAAETLAESAEG